MSKNNKSTKKGKSKKNRNKSPGEGTVSVQQFNLPRRLSYMKDIVPVRMLTKLKYLYNGTLANIGFNTASKQLNANGAFDPDPSLGSPGLTGFAEWVQFYHRYRVWEVTSKCTYSNSNAFPVVVNLGFEPDFYANNAKTLGYYENKNQVTDLMCAVGGPVTKLSMSRKAVQVVGDESCMTDIGYTGTSGTNPGSLWYTSISVSCAPLGITFANTVSVRYEADYLVEFFEPKQLVV